MSSKLWSAGYALGASLENTLVIDDDRLLNPEGLRYADEFVRHKALDAIGDLALAGAPLLGAYKSVRGGHKPQPRDPGALIADPTAWTVVEAKETRAPRQRAAMRTSRRAGRPGVSRRPVLKLRGYTPVNRNPPHSRPIAAYRHNRVAKQPSFAVDTPRGGEWRPLGVLPSDERSQDGHAGRGLVGQAWITAARATRSRSSCGAAGLQLLRQGRHHPGRSGRQALQRGPVPAEQQARLHGRPRSASRKSTASTRIRSGRARR